MITEMDIYWVTRLDVLIQLFKAFLIIGIMGTGVSVVAYTLMSKIPSFCDDEDEAPKWAKYWKRWLWLTVPFLVIGTIGVSFVPSTKEYVAIKVIPMLVNNPHIQGISEKTLQFVEKTLDVKIKDLTGEAKPEEKK